MKSRQRHPIVKLIDKCNYSSDPKYALVIGPFAYILAKIHGRNIYSVGYSYSVEL